MSVMDKARELGEELSKSQEYIAMREAEAVMLHDTTAQGILREFNTRQQEFRLIQSRGRELTEEQIKAAEDLEERMMNNPHISHFFKSQETFEKILKDVNSIIGKAIGIGPGCGCDSDCSTDACDCDGCN